MKRKIQIYAVHNALSGEIEALVKTTTTHKAVGHHTKPYTARVATQEDLVKALGAGLSIENGPDTIAPLPANTPSAEDMDMERKAA